MNSKTRKVMKRILHLLVPIVVLASCMKEAGLQESGQDITFCFSMAQPEQVELSSDKEVTSSAAGQINETKVYIHSFSSDIESGEDGEETKGAMVSSLYDTFTLFGYLFSGDWSSSCKPNFAHDVLVTRNGTWMPERELKWSGSQNVKFYAYSPGEPTGLNLLSTYNDSGAPLIEYTVPASVPSQIDLLDAESAVYKGDGSDATTGISMQFRHILTGIKFKMAAFGTPCVVKSVTVEGVYNKGRHQLGTSTWTNLSGTGSYGVSMNVNVGEEGVVSLTSGENEMMLLPQTCPAGATLTVSVEYEGNTYDLSIDLSGQVWSAGKEITYTVSTSSSGWLAHILDVGTVNVMSDGTDVQNVTSVLSYSVNVFGMKVAMPWTAMFSTDGGVTYSGTKPDWVSSFTSSGDGSKTGEGITASFTDRTIEIIESEWSFRPSVGSTSERVDLSLVSPFTREAMLRETANCYVVDAPGYYKIPLFYGNSIVNGIENSVAYTRQGKTTEQNDFIDGEGNIISTGNIVEQIGGASNVGNADLVWSSVRNMITVFPTIEYSGGVGYICFNVSSDVISEGNACIGLLKKESTDEYVWSWHIWVTSPERNIGDEFYTNAENYAFSMLNTNLGSVGPFDKAKPERVLTVKLSNPYASKIFTVKQPHETIFQRVICSRLYTLYHWGIPKALPNFATNNARPDYINKIDDKNNYEGSHGVAGINTGDILGMISHPNWYQYNGGFTSGPFRNAWDAEQIYNNSNNYSAKKTVYDPSPALYQVPFKDFMTRLVLPDSFIDNLEGGGKLLKKTLTDVNGAVWPSGGYWVATHGEGMYGYGAYLSIPQNDDVPTYSYGAMQWSKLGIRPMKRQ